MNPSSLTVVPTPIGNLGDLTPRAQEVLCQADLIACEDTRTTGPLLAKIGATAPAISYHMHNEQGRSEEILEAMEAGQRVALVSDAGMPGISDPGQVLIEKALDRGLEVTVLPGPCAFVTALVGSGLATDRFTFIGFLDKNRSKRKKALAELKDRPETLIFYEAPHRLREFLDLLLDLLGSRRACLARELTKRFEEYERGSLEDLVQRYQNKQPRGEYVLILEGADVQALAKAEQSALAEIPVEEQVLQLMATGLSKMAAVKETARQRGLKKNEVYNQVLHISAKPHRES